MSRFLAYLWRLVVILAGFVGAVLAAAFLMTAIAAGGMQPLDIANPVARIGLIAAALIQASLIGYIAFAPALVAIAWAEWRETTSFLYHALAGGAIALATFVLSPRSVDSGGLDTGLFAVVVAAGLAGGIAYWAIAGRKSGQLLTLMAQDED